MSCCGSMGVRFAAAALMMPLLAASGGADADVTYEVEAITLVGDTLPGYGGATFLSVDGTGSLAVNDAGQVVHGGIVSGGSVSCPAGSWCWGVYLATTSGVTDVILEGDAAAGTTEVFERICSGCPPLQYVSLNAEGDVAFGGWFGSGPSQGTGAFVDQHLSTQLVYAALSEQTAPDTGGGTYIHVLGVSMNDARTVGWRSAITGGSATEGIFSSVAGYFTPQYLALTGQAAPTAGGTFSGFPDGPRLSGHEAAFTANVSGGSATNGVFAVTLVSRLKRAVALQGTAAPNTGGSYATLYAPAINAGGDVVFESTVTGGTSAGGIFFDDGSTEIDVALLGQAAPGAGATFLEFKRPAINASGQVAFVGRYDGSGDNGVFLWTDGTLVPIALTGQDAPDSVGGTYTVFDNAVAISDSGTIAFRALISGGSSGSGVFLASPAVPSVPVLDPWGVGLLLAALGCMGVVMARSRRVKPDPAPREGVE